MGDYAKSRAIMGCMYSPAFIQLAGRKYLLAQ